MHKRGSQIYILAEGGDVIEHRIRTEPERFAVDLVCRARQPGDLATLVFFADGSSLALMTLVEPAAALAALDASGLFTPGSLRTRPLVHFV